MELTYILLYVLIAVVSTLVYVIRRKQNFWKDRGILHDAPHPFLGNFQGFRKDRIMQDIVGDIYRKYKGTGPFCGIYFFIRPAALILDQQLAKDVLIKHFSNFTNRGLFYNERDDPLSAHLFALDGNKWKNLRHKLSPTFTSGKMKFMFPTIVEVAERFVQTLDDVLLNGNVIEIKELCARFTTDVIGTCAFGIECNSLKDPNAEFRLMGRRAFTNTRHGNLVMALIASFPHLARKLHMRQIDETVHQFFMRVVRETVAYREQNNVKRNDFMNLLVELKKTKTFTTEDGEVLTGLTVEEVAAQAFVFFLAGFETSSTTMSFALYELARHQDVQDKARREINEILAKHDNQITYESVKDMRYLNQVIAETLRHYTIVPNLVRESLNDFVVPSNPKFVIEKGTMVLIPAAAYHHDPELYPNPQEFNPDRFSHESVLKRDSVEWLPFGDGPRNCIGKRFGEMQARVGLAFLLKNFKFTVCDRTQIPMVFDPKSFVLGAKGGIELNVEKINQNQNYLK